MDNEINRSRFVYGEIKLPILRMIGCKLGYLGMQIGCPGASWLYFRSLLGNGVAFVYTTDGMREPLSALTPDQHRDRAPRTASGSQWSRS